MATRTNSSAQAGPATLDVWVPSEAGGAAGQASLGTPATGGTQAGDADKAPQYVDELKVLGTTALAKSKTRFRADLVAQVGMMIIAGVAFALAVGYALVQGQDMVSSALENRPDGQSFVERLIAVTWPVLVLGALAIIAAVGAWMTHLRAVDADRCAMDALTRFWRDSSVPVQSRDIEDQVEYSRKAFSVLLWLARTLFIVSLGLFAATVIQIIVQGEVDLTSVVLGAGSLAGALFGTVTAMPRNVTKHLADVLQVQTAASGCNRELALLERIGKEAVANSSVSDPFIVQRNMEVAVQNAMQRIQYFVESPEADTHSAEDTGSSDNETA